MFTRSLHWNPSLGDKGAAVLGDWLATGPAVQVRCLECVAYAPPAVSASDMTLADMLFARLFR